MSSPSAITKAAPASAPRPPRSPPPPPRPAAGDLGRGPCASTPGATSASTPPGRRCSWCASLTEDGLAGWGEAHSPPIPRVAQALIADLFAPLLLGRDPLATDAIWDALYASMRLRGYGTGVMLEALAGVDIALWDLAGKALGQPVYRLLGGPYRTRIPCYLSGIPGATVEERVAGAREAVGGASRR